MSQGAFPQTDAWKTLDRLLREQLDDVDVQPIATDNFNEKGELVMVPPSVRTSYAGSGYAATSDAQKLSYDVVGRFLLLCADEDYSPDAIEQAYVSLALADRVAAIVAGARLALRSGDISEPVTLTAIEPVTCDGVGVAYALAIEVPGLGQFLGANAQPNLERQEAA